MLSLKYLITPVVCALIGWLTNWVAVKMLFRPRKPVHLLFFTLQGIFPKRQKALAANLGQTVENELISHADFERVLKDPAFVSRLNGEIEAYGLDVIQKKLVDIHPMAAMLLTDEMMEKIRGIFLEELKKGVPDLLAKIGGSLKEAVNFKEIVRERVENFSSDRLEALLFSIMKREFRFIEWVGAALGFLIGVFQLAVWIYW